jgi:hypothetical protein
MNDTPENAERMQILEMIANGQISAEDGVRLLEAIQQKSGGEDTNAETDFAASSFTEEGQAREPGEVISGEVLDEPAAFPGVEAKTGFSGTESAETWAPGAGQNREEFIRKEAPNQKIERWKRWWMIPLWVGVGITVFAGLLMFWVFQATQISFWFACTWLPFTFGIILIVLAWGLRRARWLHVRITQGKDEWPRQIAISLPLPLGLAAWFIRTFRSWIPGMAGMNIDQIIEGVNSISSDEPFYIEVDEGEDGDRVEVFIG